MITNEQIVTYIHALESGSGEFLDNLEKYAINNSVPIIRKETQSLLKVMLSITRPEKILEIGTAIGFSSILMSNYISDTAKITTIERSKDMIKEAHKNIQLTNNTNKITVLEGDADTILSELEGEFDLIFMDAAKGQYITFLPHCLRLLRKGGVLISDNVLQDGHVAKSRYSVPRRVRTIHSRMREYLWEIKHNDQLETTILPIGDGVTISYKRN